MLELRQNAVGVVRVCATEAGVATLADMPRALWFRVAKDEALLFSDPRHADEVSRAAVDRLSDSGSLVITDTDSYAAWSLVGDDVDNAFSYLSAIALPNARPALLQGLVGGVPAKIVVERMRVLILVSSALDHHLHQQALIACGSLGIAEGAAETFTPSGTDREAS